MSNPLRYSNNLIFNSGNAFEYLRKLTIDIGSRNSGSINERKAAEYISSEFKSIGLETTIQEFDTITGNIIEQTLEVIEPYKERIACRANVFTGNTSPETLTADLVYIDNVKDEYITKSLKGKIVLTKGFYRYGLEQFRNIGVLGVINIGRRHSELSHGWGDPKLKEKYGPMPTVNISYEDGVNMIKKMAKKVKLCVKTKVEKVKSQNIIGDLIGSEQPDEIVIIGGHYDTVPDVPGASDNGAGTAIVMELARVFQKKGCSRTLRFIAWGCEESGCVGSTQDVLRMRRESEKIKRENSNKTPELEKIRLVINIDVQGAIVGSNNAASMGPQELAASVKTLAKEMGIAMEIPRRGPGITNGVYSSDNTSYSSIGIPSLALIREGVGRHGHSIDDSIEWLSPQALSITGELLERFITRYISEAKLFPFERLIPEDDKKDLEKYFKSKMRTPPSQINL